MALRLGEVILAFGFSFGLERGVGVLLPVLKCKICCGEMFGSS